MCIDQGVRKTWPWCNIIRETKNRRRRKKTNFWLCKHKITKYLLGMTRCKMATSNPAAGKVSQIECVITRVSWVCISKATKRQYSPTSLQPPPLKCELVCLDLVLWWLMSLHPVMKRILLKPKYVNRLMVKQHNWDKRERDD